MKYIDDVIISSASYKHNEQLLKNESNVLNKYPHNIIVALKSEKFKVYNYESNKLLIKVEREVLKNIKSTFQTIINTKEPLLDRYEYLQEVIHNKIYKKDGLIS